MELSLYKYHLKTILVAILIWEAIFWTSFFGLYYFLLEDIYLPFCGKIKPYPI
jgi:hypothetical protein